MQEILIKVKNYFGTADAPYYGPTYILPDGSLLDLRGRGHHSSVEHFLINNNLSNREYIKTGGSPTVEALGCIRCDNVKYYIGLSEEQPTREQYNSLLVWLDDHSRTTKLITVMSPGGRISIDYRFTSDFISDDVVDRIRRYYISGKLYEQLDKSTQFKRQHNFKYKRELLGECLKEADRNSMNETQFSGEILERGALFRYKITDKELAEVRNRDYTFPDLEKEELKMDRFKNLNSKEFFELLDKSDIKNKYFSRNQFEKLKNDPGQFYCLIQDGRLTAVAFLVKNKLGANDFYVNEIQALIPGAGKILLDKIIENMSPLWLMAEPGNDRLVSYYDNFSELNKIELINSIYGMRIYFYEKGLDIESILRLLSLYRKDSISEKLIQSASDKALQEGTKKLTLIELANKLNKLPKGTSKVSILAVPGINKDRQILYIQANSKFDKSGREKYLTNSEVTDLLSDFCDKVDPIISQHFDIEHKQIVRYIDGFDFSMMYDLKDKIMEKLVQSSSDKALQQNIKTEIKAGKKPDQAVAIAYDIQRKNENMLIEKSDILKPIPESFDIIELSTFKKDWKRLGLDESDLAGLKKKLKEVPPETHIGNGVYKFRFSPKDWNVGARDGGRGYYIEIISDTKAYLVTAYRKNEKGNLTPEETKNIRDLAKVLRSK